MKTSILYKLKIHILLISVFIILFQKSFSLPDGYKNHFIYKFRYGLFIPPDYDPSIKYHLMVYLHGYTDTTSWDFYWYSEEFQEQYPCIILTPKCEKEYGLAAWGDSFSMVDKFPIRMTFRAVDTIIKYYNIDTKKMHIYGGSMGGAGVMYVLCTRPNMFASACVINAFGDPETTPVFINTPLWIFHGSEDDNISVDFSRNMYSRLIKEGGTCVRYTEYPGVGHLDIYDTIKNETTLDRWIFSQQLGSVHINPDSVESFNVYLNENNKPVLGWSEPTDQSEDDKLVWCYRIYKNSEHLVTVNPVVFSYTDTTVLPGDTNSYFVKAMNYYFKESAYSPELEISALPSGIISESISFNSSFSISPNPTNGLINIGYAENYAGKTTFEIIDITGKIRATRTIHLVQDSFYTLDISDYPNGIYFIRISNSKYSEIIKVLKNHY
ncbi:MAG: T9SS type A sorting domain-containing protein [Bacteroidales bacterium]|nr:MAG: T9SS type A sorting domain-containing protein [Bacteroidales bacterium]